MTDAEALEILRTLADGRDPLTGVELAAENVFNQVGTVRALHQAIGALEGGKAATKRDTGPKPGRAGEPWDEAEDAKLIHGWDSGLKAEALADIHNRTKGAIESRLLRLGETS